MYNYNPYNSQFNQQYNSYAQNNYLNELQQMRENSEKQKLMKMAEREKEHYRTAKEMLEKHM